MRIRKSRFIQANNQITVVRLNCPHVNCRRCGKKKRTQIRKRRRRPFICGNRYRGGKIPKPWSCPPGSPQPPVTPPPPASRQYTCDSLNGKIFQLCDGIPRVYFTSANGAPSSMILIENDTKGKMRAVIELQRGDSVEGVIEQGQQVSFDVPAISRLTIIGSGEGGICKGSYAIRIRREIK